MSKGVSGSRLSQPCEKEGVTSSPPHSPQPRQHCGPQDTVTARTGATQALKASRFRVSTAPLQPPAHRGTASRVATPFVRPALIKAYTTPTPAHPHTRTCCCSRTCQRAVTCIQHGVESSKCHFRMARRGVMVYEKVCKSEKKGRAQINALHSSQFPTCNTHIRSGWSIHQGNMVPGVW